MTVSMVFDGAVSGTTRAWLRGEGLLVLLLSVLLYWNLGARWWLFLVLLLLPDLSMLGYLVDSRAGKLSYNIVHSYVLPLGLAVAAIATHSVRLLPLVCIWTAHIGMDRVLGYGLKTSGMFGDTHLGVLGKGRA
ncbi:MAG: DUF4260 family protein [Terriglobia bacterium]|nr:DUF4260 family protein [Terriglobia bacterium]